MQRKQKERQSVCGCICPFMVMKNLIEKTKSKVEFPGTMPVIWFSIRQLPNLEYYFSLDEISCRNGDLKSCFQI